MDGKHEDPVAVALDRLAWAHLDDLDRVAELPEHASQAPEQVA